MNKIEEISTLSEQILNQQALTDAKQLGLQACTIAAQLAVENERLTAELEKYRAADQGGRLVVLPCKIGDTVYTIERDCIEGKCKHWHEGSDIFRDDDCCMLDWDDEAKCKRFKVHAIIMTNLDCVLRIVAENSFGKTVFPTREAAEQALNEQKEREPQ